MQHSVSERENQKLKRANLSLSFRSVDTETIRNVQFRFTVSFMRSRLRRDEGFVRAKSSRSLFVTAKWMPFLFHLLVTIKLGTLCFFFHFFLFETSQVRIIGTVSFVTVEIATA